MIEKGPIWAYDVGMELVALLRPLLYLVFYALVIHWVMRFLWRVIPNGKVKTFLFKRRD